MFVFLCCVLFSFVFVLFCFVLGMANRKEKFNLFGAYFRFCLSQKTGNCHSLFGENLLTIKTKGEHPAKLKTEQGAY